jgi:hypothetical protein
MGNMSKPETKFKFYKAVYEDGSGFVEISCTGGCGAFMVDLDDINSLMGKEETFKCPGWVDYSNTPPGGKGKVFKCPYNNEVRLIISEDMFDEVRKNKSHK